MCTDSNKARFVRSSTDDAFEPEEDPFIWVYVISSIRRAGQDLGGRGQNALIRKRDGKGHHKYSAPLPAFRVPSLG